MHDIEKLLDMMAKLRDPHSGCPWDAAQDFSSVAPYTLEEAYEVVDAIARDDMDALRDELGDLLFQVVFHSRIAQESGSFDFGDVSKSICDKMLRRHPHVFGTAEERAAGPSKGAWEQIKAAERAADRRDLDNSALQDIAMALPALKRAEKLGKRAAGVGFDWPDAGGPRAKIGEELGELSAAECSGNQDQINEELGDVLFSVVNLARHLGVDPEQALSGANRKFESRFRRLEESAGTDLRMLDSKALEALWEQAKTRLK